VKRVLVFDVDGVLVDVTDSYREAICQTVALFTGERPSRELIQDLKNRGGFNNDWRLTHRLIADAGVNADYEDVVARFNELFMGRDGDGLITRERWIACDGLLERLAANWRLAIFTSRMRYELDATLTRIGCGHLFHPTVTHDDVERQKPAPDGLLAIAAAHPGAEMWYAGDTVDDANAARAAGIPFIGIAAVTNPRRAELIDRLREAGARAVIDDINQLESVLPA
jgi:HAD superfamily phosphatase